MGLRSVVVVLALVACLSCVAFEGCNSQPIPGYTTYWFNQTVDHFNAETKPATWQQRYLVNDTFYDPSNGLIFFYTGNEGPIDEFWDNTGFVFDIAPQFGALIVFAEHRYYGESLPFGNDSFTIDHIGYLSVEQALADYATLIPQLKATYNATEVVSFGGSYGGMLTAYLRTLYPNVVDAGLAASAPVLLMMGETQNPGFYQAVTNDFAAANASCPDLYRSGFAQLMALKEAGAYDVITKDFSLCTPLTEEYWDWFFMWAVVSFGEMGMCDYPYASDFLAPLPAWPITYSCEVMLNATSQGLDALQGVIDTVSLFYNGTNGNLQCFNITSEYLPCSDQTGCGTGDAGLAWDYQACTEIIYFPNTNNITDMFPARDWTLANLTEHCESRWNVTPKIGWLGTFVGMAQIEDASRIIFSNGLLDPWHGGGILTNVSSSLVAVILDQGAHHLDLRASNPQDPQSVIVARETEVSYIEQWITAAKAEKSAAKKMAKLRKQ